MMLRRAENCGTRFWEIGWNEEWLKDKELSDVEKQRKVRITVKNPKRKLRKISNWKSPGPNGLQGFWPEYFTSVTRWLADQLNRCLHSKAWFQRGWRKGGRCWYWRIKSYSQCSNHLMTNSLPSLDVETSNQSISRWALLTSWERRFTAWGAKVLSQGV